jgi:hypothetical protein
MADEEDVALSVFRCLCDGAARGQFADVAIRDELWKPFQSPSNQPELSGAVSSYSPT